MDKLVKKGIELGVGVTAITIAALAEAMVVLEKQGKISKKEGERMVHEMAKKYSAQGTKFAAQMHAQLNEIADAAAPYATKKDIDTINASIEKISKQLNKTKPVKPVAKKAAKGKKGKK
jgi:polyhydroxyalkanoate synthesis regulator phasin